MEDGHTVNKAGQTDSEAVRTTVKGSVETEDGLVALLMGLRLEATPEADFESRFLYDLHERIAQEAVCRPARKLLWEHVLQMLSNIGGRKIAYGASTLGVSALAVGFFTWPSSDDATFVASPSAVTSGLERSMASLKPGTAKEFTCISVTEEKRKSFTRDQIAMQGSARFFEQHPSDLQKDNETNPVNMGLSPENGYFVPSWTTSFPH